MKINVNSPSGKYEESYERFIHADLGTGTGSSRSFIQPNSMYANKLIIHSGKPIGDVKTGSVWTVVNNSWRCVSEDAFNALCERDTVSNPNLDNLRQETYSYTSNKDVSLTGLKTFSDFGNEICGNRNGLSVISIESVPTVAGCTGNNDHGLRQVYWRVGRSKVTIKIGISGKALEKIKSEDCYALAIIANDGKGSAHISTAYDPVSGDFTLSEDGGKSLIVQYDESMGNVMEATFYAVSVSGYIFDIVDTDIFDAYEYRDNTGKSEFSIEKDLSDDERRTPCICICQYEVFTASENSTEFAIYKSEKYTGPKTDVTHVLNVEMTSNPDVANGEYLVISSGTNRELRILVNGFDIKPKCISDVSHVDLIHSGYTYIIDRSFTNAEITIEVLDRNRVITDREMYKQTVDRKLSSGADDEEIRRYSGTNSVTGTAHFQMYPMAYDDDDVFDNGGKGYFGTTPKNQPRYKNDEWT